MSLPDRRCPVPDWAAVETDYRTAGLSLRQMAARHGCHHSSIANRARRQGWRRGTAAAPADPRRAVNGHRENVPAWTRSFGDDDVPA